MMTLCVLCLLGILALFVGGADRMYEELPDTEVSGEVLVEGETFISEESLREGLIMPVDSVATNEGSGSVHTEALVGTERFSGVLEEVYTGCFADGECYVVVDGKHITTGLGWTREVVGTVKGVAGFGELAYFIGQPVSVYAGKKADGTYTLYSNTDFFIMLVAASGIEAKVGEVVLLAGVPLMVTTVLEDSRCPLGVMCVSAGTVRVAIELGEEKRKMVLTLGQPHTIPAGTLTLHRVMPEREEGVVLDTELYQFFITLTK